MSTSEAVITHLKKTASRTEEAIDYIKQVVAANPGHDRMCPRCKKPYSQLHFLPENPRLNWIEIHERGGTEVCQACDPPIGSIYIGSETFCLSTHTEEPAP